MFKYVRRGRYRYSTFLRTSFHSYAKHPGRTQSQIDLSFDVIQTTEDHPFWYRREDSRTCNRGSIVAIFCCGASRYFQPRERRLQMLVPDMTYYAVSKLIVINNKNGKKSINTCKFLTVSSRVTFSSNKAATWSWAVNKSDFNISISSFDLKYFEFG